MEERIFDILSKINSPELQAMLWWIKIPFILITAFFLWVITVSVTRTPYLQLSMLGDAVEVLTYRPWGVPKIRRRWERIMKRLDEGGETEYKLAIIEADTLLDEMLKRMRIKGENIDERLQKLTVFMVPNVEDLKGAHQIRNSVVYDPDYRLGSQEARQVLLVYQKTLEDLDLFR